MTRWLYPPALEQQREEARFDPLVVGARLGLPRQVSLVIWKRICADATDGLGRRDAEQARRKFHEMAERVAAHGGRLYADVGRITRAGIETGEMPGAWSIDDLTSRAPGRETLVTAEARRWAAMSAEPASGPEVSERTDRRAVDDHRSRRSSTTGDQAGNGDAGAATSGVNPEVHASRGEPFPGPIAIALGQIWGEDLSGARVHTDAHAARAADMVDARAFTLGNDIFFGAGTWAPWTVPGNLLIAHEAAHVVQHRRGQTAGGAKQISDHGDPLELEADAMAARAAPALQGQISARAPHPASPRDPGGSPRILRAPILR